MTDSISLAEAETRLASLVDEAVGGREILIAKDGLLVRLAPLRATTPRKPSGLLTVTRISDDFDAPDEEVNRLFEGEG
jgi:antitoxin (DNA-binding transcriptional repressor) of toxin-antitoxin stability system